MGFISDMIFKSLTGHDIHETPLGNAISHVMPFERGGVVPKRKKKAQKKAPKKKGNKKK